MREENRRSQRRPVEWQVWAERGAEAEPVELLLVDISETGARLVLEPRTTLPTEFLLRFTRDGRVARRCRLVWKTDRAAGVEFIIADVGPRADAGRPAQGLARDLWI